MRVAKFANNIDVRRIEQKRDRTRTVTNSVTVENLIGTRAILSSDNSKIDAILPVTLFLFNSIFNFPRMKRFIRSLHLAEKTIVQKIVSLSENKYRLM